MNLKSERLRKLEKEYEDLKQWLHLGLVPKKDIEKHKKEIEHLFLKIEEEKKRLIELKESGEVEEYVAPKKNPQGRQAYQEPHTLPGMDAESSGMTEAGLDLETETYENDSATASGSEDGDETTSVEEVEEDDPFSDKNRWRRGILEDPDADSW
ncbi:MAG: hypothetical protein KAR79_04400 [Simkaniaceae bacterium]|nr:hypothetical protein [Simkaniaceae bacterium]